VRKTTALLASFAIVAALTGCSSADTISGCSPTAVSGNASKIVTALGAFDSEPDIKSPTPLYAATTQASTLIAGHGAPITRGQPALLELTIVNGRTGKLLAKTPYGAQASLILTAGSSVLPAVSEALVCAQVGSRLAVVSSPKDNPLGAVKPAHGDRKSDSYIFVVDVVHAFLAKANGAVQPPQANIPRVVTTSNGAPGITLPAIPAPVALQTTVLRAGTGAQLKTGTYAIIKYTAISWTDSPTVFDSTWKIGLATSVGLGSTSLSPGLSTALTGQRVGSQIIAVIPAPLAVQADGAGAAPPGVTVVYVVDILGIPG